MEPDGTIVVNDVTDNFDFILELGPLNGDVISYGVSRGVLLLTSPVFRRMLRKDSPSSGQVGEQTLNYERTVRNNGIEALRVRSNNIWADPAFLLLDRDETPETVQEKQKLAGNIILSLMHNRHKQYLQRLLTINTIACIGAFAQDFQLLHNRVVDFWFHSTCQWEILLPEWEPSFHDSWLFIAFLMRDQEVYETCSTGILRFCSLNELKRRMEYAPDCMKPYYANYKDVVLKLVRSLLNNITTFYDDSCPLEECESTKATIFVDVFQSHLDELGTRVVKGDLNDIKRDLLVDISHFRFANILKEASERIHAECRSRHGLESQAPDDVVEPDCIKRFDENLKNSFEYDRTAVAKNLLVLKATNERLVLPTQLRENSISASVSNARIKSLWKPKDQWLLKNSIYHLGMHSYV